MNPVIRIISVDISVAVSLCFFVMNRYVIRPKNTTAIVACPLGRENDVSGIRVFSGLALWNISFDSLISISVARIVAMKKIPCFFEIFM